MLRLVNRVLVFVGCMAACFSFIVARAEEPLKVNNRRELFVDEYLIGELKGSAERKLQLPEPREVVLVADKPWEGNTSGYFTLFQDGDLYRMIYRGWHHDEKTMKALHPEVTCYAESKDGIHWIKPELGLFEYEGSKANNIIMMGPASHNFVPFKDENPAAKPEAKYKAVGSSNKGLVAFQSPDCIHWKQMQAEPIITVGAFDSQNLVFWDPAIKAYRDFHRGFRPAVDGNGKKVRDIMTATSKDFLAWPKPVYLKYPGAPDQHLYTNAILTYARAPQILLGFPTRFRPSDEQVEPILMSSRDGLTFQRWNEAVIPPDAPEDRKGNRSNYMAWGMLSLSDSPNEVSVYGTEAYYAGPAGRLRRFVYRTDGFVSLHADKTGGEMISKPLQLSSTELQLNYRTAPGGSVQVQLVNSAGETLAESEAFDSDEIDVSVTWKTASDKVDLAKQPVHLRLILKDADVYAVKFGE
jgi:hypothetical protein